MKKEDLNNITKITIILVIIFFIFFISYINEKKIKEDVAKLSSESMSPLFYAGKFMSFRVYSIQGNSIKLGRLRPLSVVGGVAGVYFIDLTMIAANTGGIDLVCDITDLAPPQFDSAMTIAKGPKLLKKGGRVSWTSALINVTPLEQSAPAVTNFSGSVLCKYNAAAGEIELPLITGYLPIIIENDLTSAAFNISLFQGGSPTEYCGDEICQLDENVTTCLVDCGSTANVNFRTTDLSYPSGSAVAYNPVCGGILRQYGKTSGVCTEFLCNNTDYTMLVPKINNGTSKFWNRANGVDVCICDPAQIKNPPRRYNTGDTDSSKVDAFPYLIDDMKEVRCSL